MVACARMCTFVLLCFHGILAAITDGVSSRFNLWQTFFFFFFFTRVRQMAPVILSSLGFLDCSPLVFPTSPCWLDCTLQLLDSKTCEWAKASLSFVGATGRSGGGGRFLLSAQCLTFLLWHKRSAYGALKIRFFSLTWLARVQERHERHRLKYLGCPHS